MKAFILYWNDHFEKETGFEQNQEVEVTGELLLRLSASFDVALMNNGNGGHRYLAIDAKYHCFRR